MKHWREVIWASACQPGTKLPKWIDDVLIAAINGPERLQVAFAAAGCRAVLAEWVDLEQLYVWLDARGYARPPAALEPHLVVARDYLARSLSGASSRRAR